MAASIPSDRSATPSPGPGCQQATAYRFKNCLQALEWARLRQRLLEAILRREAERRFRHEAAAASASLA